jgi:hypothetical protein
MKTTTITKIDHSDSSTDVVDIIHLSDGRKISSWNGNPSYFVYDEAHGRIEVGAELLSIETDESWGGEEFQRYKFG